eukprot:scaffold31550_cov17-Tisochrysis_lutea.AAC.1
MKQLDFTLLRHVKIKARVHILRNSPEHVAEWRSSVSSGCFESGTGAALHRHLLLQLSCPCRQMSLTPAPLQDLYVQCIAYFKLCKKVPRGYSEVQGAVSRNKNKVSEGLEKDQNRCSSSATLIPYNLKIPRSMFRFPATMM